MNFFEHQDLARRATKRLVILMTLAVLALIALTSLLFAVVSFGATTDSAAQVSGGHFGQHLVHQVGWETLLWISALISLAVLGGSWFKWMQLRAGGQAVAEALGGKLIPGNTKDPQQRQLLNIVEEMAIASGTPVPPVYLLEEPGINAFAAGHSPQDAVIGVTRGSIEQLNRDELQGVIAHEFSHILHGDMRLNLRLVAILNGILIIGLLGYILLRSGTGARMMGRRGGKGQGGIAILGLGLIVLGAVGIFFGKWIKSAVSRQREYLADASAVQYTRNPEGIGGALMKIGGYSKGSELETEDAEEFSHMYFSRGIRSSLSSIMATHPPLEDRIKRVLPRWDGNFGKNGKDGKAAPAAGGAAGHAAASGFAGGAGGATPATDDRPEIQPEQIARAHELLEAIPESLREAAREPFGARGVLFGLLLAQEQAASDAQWQSLASNLSEKDLGALKRTIETSARLPEEERLPAIELAMPALKQLSEDQRRDFLHALDQLIRADGRVHLREWILYRIAQHNLSRVFTTGDRLKLRYCRDEVRLLLSIAAITGAQSAEAANGSFQAGAAVLNEQWSMIPGSEVTLARLDHAVGRLAQLRPLEKPALLKALRISITHDQRITPTEAELYRAIADVLDCPTPPLSAD